MLTTVQPSARGPSERILGAGRVVELAAVVVVEHQESQGRARRTAGEAQHGDVTVGVAGGDHRSPADAAPDPDRLGRPSSNTSGSAR
jgi:hypothetical protein